MPNESLIKKYKNNLEKDPGINHNFIQWMYKELDRSESPKIGGLIFDEMTIQSGVQLQPEGEGLAMTGFVDFGNDNSGMSNVKKSRKTCGNSKYSSPICISRIKWLPIPLFLYVVQRVINWTAADHNNGYHTNTCLLWYHNPSSLHGWGIRESFPLQFYDAMHISCNRNHRLDCSHVVKKLRNSIYSSGQNENAKRWITHPLGYVEWDHFYDAYIWDQKNHNLRLHRKLTNDHFHLNNALKMRNHLADQVLNSDMLFLMQEYSKYLEDTPKLKATIELLKHTSNIIDIFRSSLSICSSNDKRLKSFQNSLDFFQTWNSYCEAHKVKGKSIFFTKESYSYLLYCLNGFLHLCELHSSAYAIQPNIINSDIIDNVFCQQRAIYSGPNTNPDATQYR